MSMNSLKNVINNGRTWMRTQVKNEAISRLTGAKVCRITTLRTWSVLGNSLKYICNHNKCPPRAYKYSSLSNKSSWSGETCWKSFTCKNNEKKRENNPISFGCKQEGTGLRETITFECCSNQKRKHETYL